MTSVLPQGHGFRNELIEMIDDIKPQFVRFPGMYGFLFMNMFWLRLWEFVLESGYHILHREVYCSAFLLSLATTVLQLQILAAFTEVLLQGLFSSLLTRNFESVTRIFYGLFFFCFWKMNFESSKSSFFLPYSWSSLFFHFPSISNPKLHPPNSQSGAAGPLPEQVLAWSNTTVSQNQFIICLTSCSSDLTDGVFFPIIWH